MTLEERNVILNSPSFHSQVRIALCDWMNYWVMIGTENIPNENVRILTENFIQKLIENLDEYTNRVVIMAISNTNIIESENFPTDQDVKSAVDTITTQCLPYLL